MTNSINPSTGLNSKVTMGSLVSDIVLTSIRSNEAAALLTVKNYKTEADEQISSISAQSADALQEQKDNVDEWNKEHKKKRRHKILGAICHVFHAIRVLTHPRKLVHSVKNVVKKSSHAIKSVGKAATKAVMHPRSMMKGMAKALIHPKDAFVSIGMAMIHPKRTVKALFKAETKVETKAATSSFEKAFDRTVEKYLPMDRINNVADSMEKALPLDRINKITKSMERVADAGDILNASADAVAENRINNIKADIENLEIVKGVSGSIGDYAESQKKQEMENIQSRVSDATASLKAFSDISNTLASMQSRMITNA